MITTSAESLTVTAGVNQVTVLSKYTMLAQPRKTTAPLHLDAAQTQQVRELLAILDVLRSHVGRIIVGSNLLDQKLSSLHKLLNPELFDPRCRSLVAPDRDEIPIAPVLSLRTIAWTGRPQPVKICSAVSARCKA